MKDPIFTRRRAVEQALAILAPDMPAADAKAILDHALTSSGLKRASAETAAWLSLVAYIRHNGTEYDILLEEGYGAEAARHFCRPAIEATLAAWGCRRHLPEVDEDGP